jgi:hypothetical protein
LLAVFAAPSFDVPPDFAGVHALLGEALLFVLDTSNAMVRRAAVLRSFIKLSWARYVYCQGNRLMAI